MHGPTFPENSRGFCGHILGLSSCPQVIVTLLGYLDSWLAPVHTHKWSLGLMPCTLARPASFPVPHPGALPQWGICTHGLIPRTPRHQAFGSLTRCPKPCVTQRQWRQRQEHCKFGVQTRPFSSALSQDEKFKGLSNFGTRETGRRIISCSRPA